jgi:hypothetical protein
MWLTPILRKGINGGLVAAGITMAVTMTFKSVPVTTEYEHLYHRPQCMRLMEDMKDMYPRHDDVIMGLYITLDQMIALEITPCYDVRSIYRSRLLVHKFSKLISILPESCRIVKELTSIVEDILFNITQDIEYDRCVQISAEYDKTNPYSKG